MARRLRGCIRVSYGRENGGASEGTSEAGGDYSRGGATVRPATAPRGGGRRGSCPGRGCRRSSDRRLEVVLDPAVADRLAVEQDVAGPPVAVARLADRADVAQGLAAVELVGVVDFLGAEELQCLSVKMPGTCVWPWKQ